MATHRQVGRLTVDIDKENPEAGNGGVVPPPETRWLPGECGNPNGRPKGAATSVDRVFEQELERLVEGDPSVGDTGPISRRRKLVRTVLDTIEDGNLPAAKLLLERLWPVPKPEDAPKPAVVIHFDAQDKDA